ncbi:MAG: guanosine monophosphate reductase [Bdellovibrionales bacterium CG10_big_fil_rev_8_21_14_0_10_45_34]|nr:MAG: guanosine monophosphate reductase [Bdellovibrionales bacterium CG10_big_fil_rev_8_21_14_0_10_45_34]
MSLFFKPSTLADREKGYSFDDVLLVPCRSEVRSRKDPDLSTQLTPRFRLKTPLISANMDTVTETNMAIAMAKLGGLGILHRFLSIDHQVEQYKSVRDAGFDCGASIGVSGDYKERLKALIDSGCSLITIDIAHGHSETMMQTISYIKSEYPEVEIIAGNVATEEAAQDLIEAGANSIKVGIGPGSMCTTRIITGCGVPQLTAIALCAEVCAKSGVSLIADGGIKTSGDIVKALAAGADLVMLGSLLSGTIETPGEIKSGRKAYRGMASKAAQVSWRGELPEGMAAEGEATSVAIKGHVSDVVSELCGGIRSGMSYLNAVTLKEIAERARFIEMTVSGFKESTAHGSY